MTIRRDYDSGSMPLTLNIKQTSTRDCENGSEIYVFGSYILICVLSFLVFEILSMNLLLQTPHLSQGMEEVFLMV